MHHMYKVGTMFVPGDEVVYEEKGTEAVCRVKAVRHHDGSVFYDLIPIKFDKDKNRRRLFIGSRFTVGIRLDCVNNSSWGLRDA